MENIYNRPTDFFSLFPSINGINSVYFEKTRLFLTDKFQISFDTIINDCQKDSSTKNVIDKLYDAIYRNAYGYSLEMFNDTTFGEFTHLRNMLTTDHKLLNDFDDQIKLHCIISALYTICAIIESSSYISLVDLPNDYSEKEYLKPFVKKRFSTKGYKKADKELIDRFRDSFESLTKPDHTFHPDPDYKRNTPVEGKFDLLNDYSCNLYILNASCNHCISNALNYSISDSTYQIGTFLAEFSFDLLINQMQIGFQIPRKIQTISKHQIDKAAFLRELKNLEPESEDFLCKDKIFHQKVNNFRRETSNFITNLNIIENNFTTTDNSLVGSLLYNWKKEKVFHINMLTYLTRQERTFNSSKYFPYECPPALFEHATELLNFPTITSMSTFHAFFESLLKTEMPKEHLQFLLNYLSEITFPVFTYTFFIALCEYFQYSLPKLKEILSAYIRQHSIYMETFSQTLFVQTIKHEKTDILGDAILRTFYSAVTIPPEPFDDSFSVNIIPMNENAYDLYQVQSSCGLAYYENILC